jgi:ferredoxin
MLEFVAVNAEFFGPDVTGWNSPRGADAQYKTTLDHPVVVNWPRQGD